MTKKSFSEILLDDIAVQIHQAIRDGKRIEAPIKSHQIDYPAAMEIRRRVVNMLARHAGMHRGYKIAFTSPNTQKILGLNEPEFGYLFEKFACKLGDPIDTKDLSEPYAEPEIAFIMDKNLIGDHITTDDVLNATKCVCPAIEIVDSRFGIYHATKEDMVADNVQFARYVLGAETFKPKEHDLSNIPVRFEVDGQEEESSTGQVMGHPAAAVAWLANKFSEFQTSDIIKEGTIILTGSCTRYFPVHPGSTLVADFGPLGSINLDFT